jgi:hypothetical protein
MCSDSGNLKIGSQSMKREGHSLLVDGGLADVATIRAEHAEHRCVVALVHL